MHRNELAALELLAFGGLADHTPQLWTVGTVKLPLPGDGETDVLGSVVLDDCTLPDPGITDDDQLPHAP